MTETSLIEIARARSEAARHLAEHEIERERRYGEINATLARVEAHGKRNLWLLCVLLGGMLAVVSKSFWPALLGG